jgi:3-oxoacyl-[acyl-carrier-protein] synthase II
MTATRAIAVTGLGLATGHGFGRDEAWKGLVSGTSAVSAIRRFDTLGLKTTIGATIDGSGLGDLSYVCRAERLAGYALTEALEQSALAPKSTAAQFFVAAPPAEMSWSRRLRLALDVGNGKRVDYPQLISQVCAMKDQELYAPYLQGGIANRLADAFDIAAAPVTVNTACASGATAIQLGVEAIRRGATDIAIVAAADAPVVPEIIVRFSLLAALSMRNDPPEEAARPFSLDRDGFVLGEGAAALILESLQSAAARRRTPLAYICGVGESADTFHLTRSSPDASASTRAIRSALKDAVLRPNQIDYVNAHGTGTPENDRIEALALRNVFGSGTMPPVSSNKSMIGHTMSAAGAIEAAFSILTLQHQLLPPTINYQLPDPEIALDVVPNVARHQTTRYVLSNSFGFGGQNVCLVFGSCPDTALSL